MCVNRLDPNVKETRYVSFPPIVFLVYYHCVLSHYEYCYAATIHRQRQQCTACHDSPSASAMYSVPWFIVCDYLPPPFRVRVQLPLISTQVSLFPYNSRHKPILTQSRLFDPQPWPTQDFPRPQYIYKSGRSIVLLVNKCSNLKVSETLAS